jgi:hypothetical protein
MVTVNPFNAPTPLPRIGFMKGQIVVPEDFDRMAEDEIVEMFEGSGDTL